MTAEADAGAEATGPGAIALAAAFAFLVALTIGELIVVGMEVERAARITVLAGLVISKVGLVLSFFMRARARRPAARLALGAIVFAGGVAVVLMLETAFRVGVH